MIAAGLVILLSAGLAQFFRGLHAGPPEWVVPARQWITDFFAWLGQDASLGLFTVKDLTRFISWLLSLPLSLVEALLYRGVLAYGWPPLPWVAIVAGVAILGHWIGGTRLAAFSGCCALYLAVFGLWPDAMQTLSIVIVTVPLAALIGLALGIWATRSRRVDSLVTTAFDIMQATPHMAYLGPVVVLFGFGQVPAMLATLIFATPPMARCVILGIRTVPPEVIEAGRMAGCTSRQLLWKVELPAAQQTLLLGLNQVVMQTLAMAVIASLVGASGLGQKLLFSLQQLLIGKATEQGIAITLIAIVLDRLTQAYAYRDFTRFAPGTSWLSRHRHLVLFLAVLAVAIIAARDVPRSCGAAEGVDHQLWAGARWRGALDLEELLRLHQAGAGLDHALFAPAAARLLSVDAVDDGDRSHRAPRLASRRPAPCHRSPSRSSASCW